MFRFFTALLSVVFALVASTASAAVMGGAHAGSHSFPLYLSVGLTLGAALSTGALTLADWAKRLDPNGKVPTIVELLQQTNEILLDMVWREGNLPTGHRTTVRTGLPTVAWRLLNQGVAPSKSATAQIDEQVGMLEAWSEVDKDLLLLNGNSAAFRLSEASAFLEAMNQEMASVLFYGNGGLTPEEFTGFSVRYSDVTATNASNVIDAGASGSDNASIWLISWNENTVSGIFPQGSKAGLIHEDFGEVTVEVTAGIAGNRMRALQERFQWKAGIALKDWRHVVRIGSIDVSDAGAANATTIIDAMETAIETLPNRTGRAVFYMNRTMRRLLRKQTRQAVAAGGGLTYENFEGKRVLMFGDVPIRICDALLNTETKV